MIRRCSHRIANQPHHKLAVRDKPHSYRVHAITQTRWLRTVVEYMTQMAVATRATDGRASHAVTVIGRFDDIFLGNGLPETGPARTGIELRRCVEQCGIATLTSIKSLVIGLLMLPAERHFRSLAPHHIECFI
jgi:hypothetical protein